MRRRLRAASFAVWLRAGGIQFAWLVILGAGAAIPLSEALIDQGWSWVSPTLGFLVVVAAGVERIFGRTTEAAVALDRLRRELAREHRMLTAAAGPYSLAEDRLPSMRNAPRNTSPGTTSRWSPTTRRSSATRPDRLGRSPRARQAHPARRTGTPDVAAQERSGLIGVWRGGVSLLGVAFTGVGFIGGRSAVVMVEWKVMPRNVRMLCSTLVSAW